MLVRVFERLADMPRVMPSLGMAAVAMPAAPAAVAPGATPLLGLRRFAWGVTGYNVAVILWGAIVRATGSGAGCGEHWPLCGGTVVQHWKTLASIIEFAHRASSGVALLLLVGLVAWTWRATPQRHLARVAAAVSAVATCNEALLGALLVLLGLTAQNRSPLRAVYFALHLTNTLLMLGALALTAHFLSRQNGRMRGGVEYRGLLPVVIGLGATLLVGVTGSLAALGDTLYPARSLREAFAQEFSAQASWLVRLRWVHPAMSVVAAVCIGMIVAAALRNPRHRALGRLVVGLLGLQLLLGALDVLLLAPLWLQIAHLFGADLVWIALVVLAARLCIVPVGCPEGAARCRMGQAAAG